MTAGAGGLVRRLPGHRRVLGVAMDNRLDLPGYKYYLRPDGSRPEVYVTFADLVEDPVSPPVNGVCRVAGPGDLAVLDRRERNYERVDVTGLLDDPPGRTWAFLGSAEGRARLAAGRRAGTAVVARSYLAAVESGFAHLGPEEWAAFERSSNLRDLPVEDLERFEL